MSTETASATAPVQPIVRLHLTFQRIKDSDKAGMMDCTSDGWPFEFVYSNVGSHHGMQGVEDGEDSRVMEFGEELYQLVRKHFSDVPPVIAD